jgi:hypothetical protein
MYATINHFFYVNEISFSNIKIITPFLFLFFFLLQISTLLHRLVLHSLEWILTLCRLSVILVKL